MSSMISRRVCKPGLFALLLILLVTALWFPVSSAAQVYGIEDPDGKFVPKIKVRIADKEIFISKVKPREKFSSISLTLNKKNRALVRNVGLLDIQWIDAENQPGRPMNFAGTKYNPKTGVFRDTMTKSIALKIIDKTTRDLFADKDLADLLTIHIEGKPCVLHDSYFERQPTDRHAARNDLSINVDKSSIEFDQSNLKKGEILNVDNRSGYPLVVGIDLPEKGTPLSPDHPQAGSDQSPQGKLAAVHHRCGFRGFCRYLFPSPTLPSLPSWRAKRSASRCGKATGYVRRVPFPFAYHRICWPGPGKSISL